MRHIILILSLIFFASSCKKENYQTNTLRLIQNNWTSMSSRWFAPNSGNNSISVKDSFQLFRSDSILIDCLFKNDSYPNLPPQPPLYCDTSAYTLLTNNSTLLFYPIYNGIKRANADTVQISVINDHLFVYYWNQGQGFGLLDSLKR